MKTALLPAFFALCLPAITPAADLTAMQQLGQAIFLDTTLAANGNQGCISCHDPASGFSAPTSSTVNGSGIMAGSVVTRAGNRKPPTLAYAFAAPVLHHMMEEGEPLFVGGAFHDGRATGYRFGSPLADQAAGPFTNPVEMALPHEACVVAKIAAAVRSGILGAGLDTRATGALLAPKLPASLATDCANPGATITLDEDTAAATDAAMAVITRALAAFESSGEVNRFSSRYDAYVAGTGKLSDQELAGLDLFENEGQCAACHILDPGPNGEPTLFTDYTFDNLGVPANAANPWYGEAVNAAGQAWVDRGLAQTLEGDAVYAALAPTAEGKQKVPTLRNVAAMASPDAGRSYMHNGYFKTLEGVVRFYNTRDVWPKCADARTSEADSMAQKCWPVAEVPATVNHDELGNLKLSETQEAAIVAFMLTLSDE